MKKISQINNMRKKSFKEVEGFPNYEISNYGRVVSSFEKGFKILKPQKDAMGYLHCRLYKDDESLGRYKNGAKKPKLEKVHRLVPKAFVDKPDTEQYLDVNHKDSDKTNNHHSNLEWVTRSQNIQHSYDQGNRDRLYQHLASMNRKPVKLTRMDGTIEYYVSSLHCGLSNGTSPGSITATLIKQDKGKEPTFNRSNFKVERIKEIPKGEQWLMVAGIEEKLLAYRDKYYGKTEELRKKRREYARAWRKRHKKTK